MLAYLQIRANWVATFDCKQTVSTFKLEADFSRLPEEQGSGKSRGRKAELPGFKFGLMKVILLHACLEHSEGPKPTPVEVVSIPCMMGRKTESRTWYRQQLLYIHIYIYLQHTVRIYTKRNGRP